MAKLEDLPALLPLLMCKYLPDIKSLYALTAASEVYAANFAFNAASILETLMESTLTEELT